MRIVGGQYKGSKLFTPQSNATRPTSDRVREALFNKLEHGTNDFDWANIRVLDLFAGTGALGIEALSRGATFAFFVEQASQARGLIRRNIEHLSLTGKTKLFRRDATSLGPLKRFQPFNLVFLDPPYEQSLGEKALTAAIKGEWLAEKALIILEESKRAEINWPEGIAILESRPFGDTVIYFAKFCLE